MSNPENPYTHPATGIVVLSLGALALFSRCDFYTPSTVHARTVVTQSAPSPDGTFVDIAQGVAVEAICVNNSPDGIRSVILEGVHEYEIVVVPLNNLQALNDPFRADKQSPPQDRFAGLDGCDEIK